ncbi:MAG: hypothetical protein KY469_20970, partial [Actinobacteria bacterium]|nr:hypothetical protein [Actinomycetota bacterium]
MDRSPGRRSSHRAWAAPRLACSPGPGRLPPSTDPPGALRIGALVTVAAVVVGAALVARAPLEPFDRTVLWILGALALVRSAVLWLAQRRGRERLRRGAFWLTAWALFDIGLIGGAIATTGGGSSDLAFLLVLPILFFTTQLGPWEQGLLFWSSIVVFAAASALSSTPVSWPDVALRALVLTITAVVSSYLAGRLRVQAELSRQAERLAERRAQLLAMVALAGRSISRLRADDVIERLVTAAVGLGLPAAALYRVDATSGTYRCDHERGLPQARGRELPLGGVVADVVAAGETRVVVDVADRPEPLPGLRDRGLRTVAAVPITGDGSEVIAVLVAADGGAVAAEGDGGAIAADGGGGAIAADGGGGAIAADGGGGAIAAEQLEALELLASLAAVALGNARRFAAESAVRRRVEELSRLQEDFIATASHELRTPLTIVCGAAELLEDRWDVLGSDQRRDFVRRIRRHGADLERLAERMRRYHDLGAGEHDPDPVRITLVDTVARVVERAGPITRDHVIGWDVAPQLAVIADLELVEAALDALIDNAARYTPPGTHISVTAAVADDRVRVTVSDDGPGLPADVLAEAQRAFGRGGDVLTRGTRGVGLGLVTVRRIAGLHGGELHLDSSPGTGTTVSFDLPAAPTAARDLRRRLAASPVIDSDGQLVILYQDFKRDRRDFQNLEGPPWPEPFSLVVTRPVGAGRNTARAGVHRPVHPARPARPGHPHHPAGIGHRHRPARHHPPARRRQVHRRAVHGSLPHPRVRSHPPGHPRLAAPAAGHAPRPLPRPGLRPAHRLDPRRPPEGQLGRRRRHPTRRHRPSLPRHRRPPHPHGRRRLERRHGPRHPHLHMDLPRRPHHHLHPPTRPVTTPPDRAVRTDQDPNHQRPRRTSTPSDRAPVRVGARP